MRIGLGQRGRDAPGGGGEHHRPRHVAAAAENDVRLPPLKDPSGGDRRPRGDEGGSECGDARRSWQAADLEGVELEARGRDETRLDPLRRAGEAHGDAAFPELLCDREGGQDVSRRPPGRDQAP